MIVTNAFLGPGTAPLINSKFFSASTLTYTLGAEIKADIFEAGDKIDASAISKGKGFQGAIKRFGQHRGPMAHGSKFHRHQGSNGACSSPSKVFKGKGMPGHMGCKKVTIQNLQVVRVDAEKNLLLIKGAVPFVYAMSVYDFFLSCFIFVDNLFFLINKADLYCTVTVVVYCLNLGYNTRS